jgi:hypothetical protein
MKKKYIRPVMLQQDIAPTTMICDSLRSGGKDGGSGTPEARRRVVCDDEDSEPWDW